MRSKHLAEVCRTRLDDEDATHEVWLGLIETEARVRLTGLYARASSVPKDVFVEHRGIKQCTGARRMSDGVVRVRLRGDLARRELGRTGEA